MAIVSRRKQIWTTKLLSIEILFPYETSPLNKLISNKKILCKTSRPKVKLFIYTFQYTFLRN